MKLASLRTLALVALNLVVAVAAHANPITFSTSAVAPITIGPSSDTVELYSNSTVLPDLGSITFQTGNVFIGNSPIADQIISFSFSDMVTINGITQNITISGQDNVTTGPDTITIFSGNPVAFGDLSLQLNGITFSGGGSVGENIPFTLSADLTQTPEPASFALLASGIKRHCTDQPLSPSRQSLTPGRGMAPSRSSAPFSRKLKKSVTYLAKGSRPRLPLSFRTSSPTSACHPASKHQHT